MKTNFATYYARLTRCSGFGLFWMPQPSPVHYGLFGQLNATLPFRLLVVFLRQRLLVSVDILTAILMWVNSLLIGGRWRAACANQVYRLTHFIFRSSLASYFVASHGLLGLRSLTAPQTPRSAGRKVCQASWHLFFMPRASAGFVVIDLFHVKHS